MTTPVVPRRRRRVGLIALIVVGSLILLPVAALITATTIAFSDARIDTAGAVDFRNRLPIPPLAPSTIDAEGRRVFNLDLRQGRADFGIGADARTYGINQDHLGPTIRATRGERVLMNVTNSLDETTSLHWHGMHLPAHADGGPRQEIAPRGLWSPSWRINQPAASLWYHPHPHGRTAEHVYRGLAGMFLIDEPGGPALPAEYGVDDVPLIVQDKNLENDGDLDDATRFMGSTGIIGDQILVNGMGAPYLDVPTERIRLRVLNASNARVFNFGLDNGRPVTLIGTDGGLLEHPERLDRVPLSPGERAEIIVDMSPGERTTLRAYPISVAGDFLQQRLSGADDTLDILRLRAADQPRPTATIPADLVKAPELGAPARTRTFRLATPKINGRTMAMDRIDETVTVDTTERWVITNNDGAPHNFHIHDVQFQIVEVDGDPPPAHLRGRKDTVLVPANGTVTVHVRFADFTDPATPYMFHCHLLWHEDRGMMGQFVVVKPGESAASQPRTPGHRHG